MGKKLKDWKDIYICDPDKQPDCKSNGRQGWCGVYCFCTTDINKASKPLTKLTYKQHEKEADKRISAYAEYMVKEQEKNNKFPL